MANVYKLSSSPLVLGSTEIEVTDDIVLYAEVDVETTLKIAKVATVTHYQSHLGQMTSGFSTSKRMEIYF